MATKRGFNTTELTKDPDDWAELIYVRAAEGDINDQALAWLDFWGPVSDRLGLSDDPRARNISYGTFIEAQRQAPAKPNPDRKETFDAATELWKLCAEVIGVLRPLYDSSERVRFVMHNMESATATCTHLMDLSHEL